jgi:predicted dienelactone hydrolase
MEDVIIAAASGAVALAIAVVLPLAVRVLRFPRPSGPYGVGTITHHWVDTERPDVFTADPDDRRELVVQIWYPATCPASASPAPYVPDADVLAPLAKLLNLPRLALRCLKYISTNAVPSAAVARSESSFPVLVFSPGRGGYRQHNTWQVEELVSRGYVVAAIDHPHSVAGVRFPDGRLVTLDSRMLDNDFVDTVVPFLAQDAVFALDQLTALNHADPTGFLTGRLDVSRVGIFGLSLGGDVAAEACLRESRFRACLPMDVWMPPDVVRSGLSQPTMWITRDAPTMRREGWSPADIDRTLTTIRAVFDTASSDAYLVQVPGMYHQDFSDASLLSPLTRWLGVTGPIDKHRAHDIVTACSLAFFDRHLRDRPAAFDGLADRFPEVLFETS